MRISKLAMLCCLGLAAGLPQAHATTLKQAKSAGFVRGANANEIPYGYMNENGDAKGIGPDVATAVFKSLGIKDINWTVTPFGSLIPGLKASRYDFVAAEMNILPARCQQVLFTTPDSSYGEGLLVPKGNPKNIHGYEAFKKNPALKVAVVTGADELDFLHGMGIPDSQIIMIQANADGPSTVETGRADAYAATELTVARLAKMSGGAVEQAKPFVDPVVDGKTVRSYGGFAFRKQDKALEAAFNTALVAFKKTDAYTKILSSYGLSSTSIAAGRAASTASLCADK
jgi:polar amino acid transport system substrate-binding protein